ncbi:hypothetical protein RUM43_012485 [Polyplax serrata]|uniref:Cytochrome b-c1 complex subunit 7 n=1 Tax=Polyplax serrata TaxID=468196 RepID=A0AAN8NXC4_POLSC
MALFRTRGILSGIRNLHTTSALPQKNPSEFMFKISGYYKFGLLKDDFLWDYDEDVAEALRRAPEHIRMERIYRAIKAQHAEISHTLLPKEEWTKIDDNHSYLQPYLAEVRAEKREKEEWRANN